MSFEIARAVWNYTGLELNGTQTSILARMAWYASDAGRDIFPTIATLSQQTKFSERTVRETVKYLKENKFIIVEEASAGRKAVNYKINLTKLQITSQFNERSSQVSDIEPCAKCRVGAEPCAKCRVNPANGAINPAAAAYIKTSKHNYKNNNVVVDENLLKLTEQANMKESDLNSFFRNF